jgi:hypothetical protein
MNAWIILWKIVLIVGIILFAGTVVYIIPTGLKDIMRFFKSLDDPDE